MTSPLSSEYYKVENRPVPRSLTVVIPALNEEEAIGKTIEGCMAVQMSLKERSPIKDVEIVVVSDGSVDRTADIARSYEDISVIVCENNHGYGAAIKRGFEKGSGDLLGFLDADGTCDPNFFIDLCNVASETPADVVLGSRMHKKSKMPLVRRMGNQMYALLMSYLSGSRITDTTSGMRVVRKDALPKLYPLPDGLHFTPAMTCRALLHNDLTIREIPMPYNERVGTSKLKVFKDGFGFLLAITDIALKYRPLKFFGVADALLFLVAFLYSFSPLFIYLEQRAVPDSSIYRLLTINTMILAGLMLMTVGIVAERVAASLNGGKRKYTFIERFLLSFCSTKNMLLAGLALVLIGVTLNIGTILDYFTTLHISYHWVYVSTGALFILAGMQLTAVGVFERLIETILTKKDK
jgi:glycosyltransferase involved in cell wall biosynthesis